MTLKELDERGAVLHQQIAALSPGEFIDVPLKDRWVARGEAERMARALPQGPWLYFDARQVGKTYRITRLEIAP